jgi:hypothetical protein
LRIRHWADTDERKEQIWSVAIDSAKAVTAGAGLCALESSPKGAYMTDLTFRRWLGPLGLLAAVLIFVGLGPLGSGVPGENASGITVAHYINAGLALLTVFMVTVHGVLRESNQKVLPTSFLVGFIVFFTSFLVSGSFTVVTILAAHNHDYAVAHIANFTSNNGELGVLLGLAMITLIAGLAILTNRDRLVLPKTLGWYSLLVAVVSCLGPLSGLSLVFGLPIWVIATGFVISTKTRRGTLGPSGDVGVASVAAPAAQPVAV